MTQLVKNLPAMRETWVRSLGWEDPLEKEKATHSSILAWRIPWTTVHWVAKSWTGLSNFHFHFQLCSRALPDPEIKPASPALAGIFFTAKPSGKSLFSVTIALSLNFFHCYSDMMGYKFQQSLLARNYEK